MYELALYAGQSKISGVSDGMGLDARSRVKLAMEFFE
jgi:hypothetical protein